MIASRAAKPPFPSQLSSRTVLAFKGSFAAPVVAPLTAAGRSETLLPDKGKGATAKANQLIPTPASRGSAPAQKPFTS